MVLISQMYTIPTFGMGIKCSTVGNLFLLALLMAEIAWMNLFIATIEYSIPGMYLKVSIVAGLDLCLGSLILMPGLSVSGGS